ncbi:hypothetical protein HPHPH43_1139 [Helicobacter pylori Hp H-43]|nr:hypothetical protein HPHPH43_1139 [Helicobacter pylori Hp H-43]
MIKIKPFYNFNCKKYLKHFLNSIKTGLDLIFSGNFGFDFYA